MHEIKKEYCEKLLKISGKYPKRKVIEQYENGERKAYTNTVIALASILGEADWKKIIV